MKKLPYRLWISLILLVSVSLACNLASGSNASEPTAASTSTRAAATAAPTASVTPTQKEAAAATPTSSPTRLATKAVSAAATATQPPQCSTRVNLKIRKGPGIAYDPPLTAVEPNTKLIPSGFNPLGIPGGSWVLVSALDNSFTGWASASADFLTCNIDLTTLPPVEVAPPPVQVSAPKVSNNGGFGDCPLNLTCDDSFSAATLSAVNAHFTDSDTNGDGVVNVIFEIWDSNESVKFYDRQETNPVYCTFGGDGPCNGWTFENGAFRWEPGSAAVEPGDYVVIMTINGTTPDENGNSQGQLRHFFRIEAP